MSWAKLDDRFHENRKVKRVWRRCPLAVGLHVMAITYCAGHETDGLVDVEFVEEKVPKERDRVRAVAALVEADLWHEVKDGWQIHDFLEFNPSREKAAQAREAKSEAGKKGADARWRRGKDEAEAKARAIAPVNGTAMADDAPDPTPSRPQLKDNSPGTADASDRVSAAGSGAGSLSEDEVLAEEVRGVLQRGIDSLTSNEPARAPTRAAVLKAIREHRPSPLDAKAIATEVRSIAQSQNRAPNIAALYAQKLGQHVSTSRAAA